MVDRGSTANTRGEKQFGPRIAPPTFRYPPVDDDPNRFELWSIRVPSDLNIDEKIDGANFLFPQLLDQKTTTSGKKRKASKQPGGAKVEGGSMAVASLHKNDRFTLAMAECNSMELEKLRVLVPSDSSSEDQFGMRLLNKKFDRSFMVVPETLGETQTSTQQDKKNSNAVLAPSHENSIMPNDKVNLRLAYGPIKQVECLQRRWKPYGAPMVKKGTELGLENDNKRIKLDSPTENHVSADSSKKEKKKKHKKEKKQKKSKRENKTKK